MAREERMKMHLHAYIHRTTEIQTGQLWQWWTNGYSRFRILPMGVHCTVHMHKLCAMIAMLIAMKVTGSRNCVWIIGLLFSCGLYENRQTENRKFCQYISNAFPSNYSPLETVTAIKKCDFEFLCVFFFGNRLNEWEKKATDHSHTITRICVRATFILNHKTV